MTNRGYQYEGTIDLIHGRVTSKLIALRFLDVEIFLLEGNVCNCVPAS